MSLQASKPTVTTWQRFAKQVRQRQTHLLEKLDDFPNAVLVAGCQRSGTTMLARIINASEGMADYWVGEDDELDAALLLSGHDSRRLPGRHCFQTTYLNERFEEYFQHAGYRLVWVLRRPHSVVHSMLHNWRRFALNELFDDCGAQLLDEPYRSRHERFGRLGVPRLMRACYAYNGKISQVKALRRQLDETRLQVVDYDDLVHNKARILPRLYEFLELPYRPGQEADIRSNSLTKAERAGRREQEAVSQLCMPVYEDLLPLCSIK